MTLPLCIVTKSAVCTQQNARHLYVFYVKQLKKKVRNNALTQS